MTQDGLAADSRFLAHVLRHRPATLGLRLGDGGWVSVDALQAALALHGRPMDDARLARLVEGSGKKRFELQDGRIRAAQGHSVDVDLGLTPSAPPAVLFHGTAEHSLRRILAEGLRPMGRNDVHLSATADTARAVGARHGRPVVLVVDAAALQGAGRTFRQATNGVWLTGSVEPRYLALHDGD